MRTILGIPHVLVNDCMDYYHLPISLIRERALAVRKPGTDPTDINMLDIVIQ